MRSCGRSVRLDASSHRQTKRYWCSSTCAKANSLPNLPPASRYRPRPTGAVCRNRGPAGCSRTHAGPSTPRREKKAALPGPRRNTRALAADRLFYSGTHRGHGMNLQTVSCPNGELLWGSGDLPGSTHGTTAARIWQILAALANAGLTRWRLGATKAWTQPETNCSRLTRAETSPNPQDSPAGLNRRCASSEEQQALMQGHSVEPRWGGCVDDPGTRLWVARRPDP